MSNNKVRRQLENRMREINARLARIQHPDEEERLHNELLYLQGALAGLDARNGRKSDLIKNLKGRR
jgi:hypothetical protein